MRIAFLGNSEAGKTTLATKLAEEKSARYLTPIQPFKRWLEVAYGLPHGITDDKTKRHKYPTGEPVDESISTYKRITGVNPDIYYFRALLTVTTRVTVLQAMVNAWKVTQRFCPGIYADMIPLEHTGVEIWDSIREPQEIQRINPDVVFLVTRPGEVVRESDHNLDAILGLVTCPVYHIDNTNFEGFPKVLFWASKLTGLKVESEVLDYLRAQGYLIQESTQEQQYQGIDGWMEWESEWVPIQVKCDMMAQKTGNLCFELDVNDKPSWFYTGKADFTYVRVGECIYGYRNSDIRARVHKKGWDAIRGHRKETKQAQQGRHSHTRVTLGLIGIDKLKAEGLLWRF